MSAFDLFAYGTLRSGGAGAARLVACEKVADATVGGTLYDVDGRFPALLYYGSDRVRGEVWRCPADLLVALDAWEGTASGLFRRTAVEAETDTGTRLPCWAYTAGPALARQLTPERRIPSGSWGSTATPHTRTPTGSRRADR